MAREGNQELTGGRGFGEVRPTIENPRVRGGGHKNSKQQVGPENSRKRCVHLGTYDHTKKKKEVALSCGVQQKKTWAKPLERARKGDRGIQKEASVHWKTSRVQLTEKAGKGLIGLESPGG